MVQKIKKAQKSTQDVMGKCVFLTPTCAPKGKQRKATGYFKESPTGSLGKVTRLCYRTLAGIGSLPGTTAENVAWI